MQISSKDATVPLLSEQRVHGKLLALLLGFWTFSLVSWPFSYLPTRAAWSNSLSFFLLTVSAYLSVCLSLSGLQFHIGCVCHRHLVPLSGFPCTLLLKRSPVASLTLRAHLLGMVLIAIEITSS